MGVVNREMSRLLSYARLHPPGEWEARNWHLIATLKPAVHWALLQEARRPACLWYVKKGQSLQLSPEDLAVAKEWGTYRQYSWESGCRISGGGGVGESPASRKMRDAFPDLASTAELFERFASAIPPLAHSWATEFPEILKRRPKFSKGYPLRAMWEASSLIRAMEERFPAKMKGDGFLPIRFEELPEWANIFLCSPTGEWGPRMK
jgi:hypothetical protein